MAVKMRYERVARLNTSTAQSPTWSLMGQGFRDLSESLNPTVDETTYIDDVSATKTVTGYAPEYSFEGDVDATDPAITYLRNIAETRATGANAETEMIVYDLWSAVGGVVDATKYAVAVAMDSAGGGEGGGKLEFSGTLLNKGDGVSGSYTIATGSFVAGS